MTGFGDQIAADRIDLFGDLADVELFADRCANILEAGAAIGQERAVVLPRDRRALRLVVLVRNVADDKLDQILDRHQPVAAAVFVDDQRQMNPRRLHLGEKIERRH